MRATVLADSLVQQELSVLAKSVLESNGEVVSAAVVQSAMASVSSHVGRLSELVSLSQWSSVVVQSLVPGLVSVVQFAVATWLQMAARQAGGRSFGG